MSTLATAVQARIATSRLVQLTRPNDDTATTVDTTYLEYAVTDVEAEFQTWAQETFDATDARHLALGVAGVMSMLRLWKGQSKDEEAAMDGWRKRCQEYAKTSQRRRITPTASSASEPSPERRDADGSVRPTFDVPKFDSLDVEVPNSGTDDRTQLP